MRAGQATSSSRSSCRNPSPSAVWRIGPHGKNVDRAGKPGRTLQPRRPELARRPCLPSGPGGRLRPAAGRRCGSNRPRTCCTSVGSLTCRTERVGGSSASTGELTFTPARSPAEERPAEHPKATPAADDLQGPRVVPSSFFGTTTHVNSEGLIRLLQDLGIRNVRIDFPWIGLEPSRGQYNFDPGLWMLASADLGLKHNLDQLVVLTNPPAWSVGKHRTWPNDQSIAVLKKPCSTRLQVQGKDPALGGGQRTEHGGLAGAYIAFLKAYYRGVKRADLKNKVMLCGFAGVEHAQFDAVYRMGGKEYFDILGSHSYTRPAMPEDGAMSRRSRLFAT